jgi:hypothetical protein
MKRSWLVKLALKDFRKIANRGWTSKAIYRINGNNPKFAQADKALWI